MTADTRAVVSTKLNENASLSDTTALVEADPRGAFVADLGDHRAATRRRLCACAHQSRTVSPTLDGLSQGTIMFS